MPETAKNPVPSAPVLGKNAELTLTVTGLNNLGCGVAKLPDGRAVFVAGAVPGDRIAATVIKINKTYAVARLSRVISPSPDRAEGLCSAPASCGGCVYRCLSYAKELELKREDVRHAFLKAGLTVTVDPVRIAGAPAHYRNKAEYPITEGKNGLFGGFYAQKTHKVIPADDCALQPPVFGEILRATCAYFTARGVRAYNEQTGKGLLRHLYLRHGKGTGEVMVCLVVNGKAMPDEAGYAAMLRETFPQVTSVLLNTNTAATNLVLGKTYRTLWGKDHLTDTLCGLTFDIAPAAFYQVNHDGAELLYATAAEKAALTGEELLLDLYCGAGTVGLSMAARVRELIGVEIEPAAVACARENATRNGVKNASFYCGDAANTEKLLAAAEAARGAIYPDVVVLDPPRKGCEGALLDFLAARGVPRIVYISCNPASLARDAARLAANGYAVGAATPVDMFPRTGHIETVCLLRKR